MSEIDTVVARYVPRLKSIQILNFVPKLALKWPEVTDEYFEAESRIIADLRADLQKEFMKKIRLPEGSTSRIALNHYLQSI